MKQPILCRFDPNYLPLEYDYSKIGLVVQGALIFEQLKHYNYRPIIIYNVHHSCSDGHPIMQTNDMQLLIPSHYEALIT